VTAGAGTNGIPAGGPAIGTGSGGADPFDDGDATVIAAAIRGGPFCTLCVVYLAGVAPRQVIRVLPSIAAAGELQTSTDAQCRRCLSVTRTYAITRPHPPVRHARDGV
jgi:hypothetical protein